MLFFTDFNNNLQVIYLKNQTYRTPQFFKLQFPVHYEMCLALTCSVKIFVKYKLLSRDLKESSADGLPYEKGKNHTFQNYTN